MSICGFVGCVIVLTTFSLLLAACGGSSSSGHPKKTATPTATATATSTATATATSTATATATPTATATATPTQELIYSSNQGADSVTAYPADCAREFCTSAPVFSIAGANTGLSAPSGIVATSNGTMFVANSTANSITIYAAAKCTSGTCNVTPTASFQGANTLLSEPQGMAFDSAANLFVTGGVTSGQFVSKFARGSCGGGTCNVSPTVIITGNQTHFTAPSQVAVDQSGNLYVADAGDGTIKVFSASSCTSGSCNVAPTATITNADNPAAIPSGVAFNFFGDLMVSDSTADAIYIFAASSLCSSGSCSVSPTVTISGADTRLSKPENLFVDIDENLYVANSGSNSILVFFPDSCSPVPARFSPREQLAELPPESISLSRGLWAVATSRQLAWPA